MAKKLGSDAPHTVLTSVTVSVSDDEVHLLIMRDFVHTLVKRDGVTWCITESVHQLLMKICEYSKAPQIRAFGCSIFKTLRKTTVREHRRKCG